MIPNDFGIIRQADHNLLACLFPNFTDISEYDFEIIHPEYIDNGMILNNGNYVGSSYFSYAVVDISKYDYVLTGSSTSGITVNSSGTTGSSTGTGETFSKYIASRSSSGEIVSSWGILPVDKDYLVVNVSIKMYMPVIGFIRHRSDHVNPLGIIQPLDPGMLRPQVEDPDVEEEALDEVDPYPEDN